MPIAIHTMGKVASVSVMQMLTKRGSKPHHLHYGYWPEGEFSSASQLKIGAKIHKEDDSWRIITLVRKPLWRNLSAFFHNLKKYNGLDYYNYESLRNSFIFNYNHANGQDWFTYDFRQLYRFSAFTMPFDPAAGYAIWNIRPALSMLVIRTEDLNRVAPKAFEEFMGLENVETDIVNFTRTQWYGRMKKSLTVPRTLIQYVNNFEYAKYFYTEEELEEDYDYADPEEPDPWELVDQRPERS